MSHNEELGEELESSNERFRQKNPGSKQVKIVPPPKLRKRSLNGLNLSLSGKALAVSFRDNSDSAMSTSLQLSTSYNPDSEASYLSQCFSSVEKIGEGSFGEVFKVRSNDDGRQYAIKMSRTLFRSEFNRKERLEEVKRYEEFSGHINCVRFYRAWEQQDRLYIQMELCSENLEAYLLRNPKLPEQRIWSILLDLLEGLKSLHDRNFIHLDIKLDNVLLGDGGICKLADFGLVVDMNKLQGSSDITEGDSRYVAPEVFDCNFSKAADIFSLGITMLEICCFLELPKNGPLWHRLRKLQLPDEFFSHISSELQTVIRRMLDPQPLQRPTVDELLGHAKLEALKRDRRVWEPIVQANNGNQLPDNQLLEDNAPNFHNNCSTPETKTSKVNFSMEMEEVMSEVTGASSTAQSFEEVDSGSFDTTPSGFVNHSAVFSTPFAPLENVGPIRTYSRRSLFPPTDDDLNVSNVINVVNGENVDNAAVGVADGCVGDLGSSVVAQQKNCHRPNVVDENNSAPDAGKSAIKRGRLEHVENDDDDEIGLQLIRLEALPAKRFLF